jgi:hypothetical protein
MSESTPVRSRLSSLARLMSRNKLEPPHGVEQPNSTRLRLVTGYFDLISGFAALQSLVLIYLLAFPPFDGARGAMIVGVIGSVLSTVGLQWTSRELRNRSRLAWAPGLLALATPIVLWLVGKPAPMIALMLAVTGLVMLVSVRRELD